MIHPLRVAILGTSLLIGCGSVQSQLDAQSDGDHVRDSALGLFIDRSTTDRLNGDAGDNTDWKYVDIMDKGQLRLSVSIDSPDQLKGAEVAIHDEFGSRLERLLVLPNQTNYIFKTEVEKIPNKFFVRVFTKQGTSVYTVGATLAYAPEPPPPVIAPTPIVEPTPIAPRPPKVRKKPRKTKKPEPRIVAPKPTPPPPPVAASLSGRVIRVIPSADNSAVTVTIRVNGTASKGAKGTIYKNGSPLGSFRLLKGGKTVNAFIKKPPGKFTGSLTVKIRN